ncbi:MAG: FKBP-type peptidyl-prolyl cis-trans isomerase [Ardenticatenales bacterium]|nr:FKBP-type peptidyl-prolyl cis-trans isomerase [Ardenticatenales bacterium]
MNRTTTAALLCAALLPFAAAACGQTTTTDGADPNAAAPTAAVEESAGQADAGVQDAAPVMPVSALCAAEPTLPDISGDGFTEMDGGLKIKDTVVGTGAEVKPGMASAIHYAGFLEDGTLFDTSCTRGAPYPTDLTGGVIDGWLQGIPGMKVGGRRILVIPGDLGYGAAGNGGIPPNATLIFEVEAAVSQ